MVFAISSCNKSQLNSEKYLGWTLTLLPYYDIITDDTINAEHLIV